MALNLTPIAGQRIAQVSGAKTVTAQEARDRAMKAFNDALVTGASPSQPNATLDPASKPLKQEEEENVLNPLIHSAEPIVEATLEGGESTSAPTLLDEAPKTSETVDPREAKIAAHYAALARKEKAIRLREAQLRQREAPAPQPQLSQTQQPQQDLTKFVSKDDLLQNPFGILNDLGLSYEQLTEKALQAPSREYLEQQKELAAVKAELKALRENSDQIKKSFEENQTESRQQAERQIKQDVIRLVSQDPRFEVIKANGAHSQVVKLITSVFDNGMGPEYPKGTVLDIDEAASMIEDELTARALRLTQLKKIQSRIGNRQANDNPSAQKQNQTQQQSQRLTTLTNNVGQTSRKLNSRERAIAAFRGENVG